MTQPRRLSPFFPRAPIIIIPRQPSCALRRIGTSPSDRIPVVFFRLSPSSLPPAHVYIPCLTLPYLTLPHLLGPGLLLQLLSRAQQTNLTKGPGCRRTMPATRISYPACLD